MVSREDDLASRGEVVELADGDDVGDLFDEVVFVEAEQVDGGFAGVQAGAGVGDHLDELGDGGDVDHVVAQVLGGCAGAILANLMFALPAIELSTQARSSGALWLSEVVATAGLLLVIYGCLRTGHANAVPYAVGLWIAGAYWFTSSTSFANPAVTIARTLSDSFAGIKPASVPMFIVMQLIGVAIALALIGVLYPTTTQEVEHG